MLAGWTGPSSDTEKEKRGKSHGSDRAARRNREVDAASDDASDKRRLARPPDYSASGLSRISAGTVGNPAHEWRSSVVSGGSRLTRRSRS
jgi:hypothetical protein